MLSLLFSLSIDVRFGNEKLLQLHLSTQFFKICRKFDIEIELMHMCFKSFCLGILGRSFVIYDANIAFHKIYANWISMERTYLCTTVERTSERERKSTLKNIYVQHSFVFVWFRIKSGKFASPCMMWDCILLDHFSVRLITLSRPHTLSYMIFAMNAIKLHANYNFECKWIIFNRCPILSIFLFTLWSQPSSHSLLPPLFLFGRSVAVSQYKIYC